MLNNYWKPNRWNATHLKQFRHVQNSYNLKIGMSTHHCTDRRELFDNGLGDLNNFTLHNAAIMRHNEIILQFIAIGRVADGKYITL